MNKLKELWQYSLFRWCVCVLPHFIVLVFLIISVNMNWFGFGERGHNHHIFIPIANTVLISFIINFLVSPLYIWRKQIKKLWQDAVFRWCVYQIPPLVFWLVLYFNASSSDQDDIKLIWIPILTLPTLWVWRKPIWKQIKRVVGFLNKKAEER
jgi:hypothetical protein